MYSIYIPLTKSIQEIRSIIEQFDTAGYLTDNVILGGRWVEFIATVPQGATIVVYSVDFFPSLMELLSTLAALQERGVVLKSLQEPWLSDPVGSTSDFLAKIRELAVLLHQNRTRAGLAKARSAGKKLGRPVGWRKDRTGGRG